MIFFPEHEIRFCLHENQLHVVGDLRYEGCRQVRCCHGNWTLTGAVLPSCGEVLCGGFCLRCMFSLLWCTTNLFLELILDEDFTASSFSDVLESLVHLNFDYFHTFMIQYHSILLHSLFSTQVAVVVL